MLQAAKPDYLMLAQLQMSIINMTNRCGICILGYYRQQVINTYFTK